MGGGIGINWYARLQKKIADLEHKLEDVQAHNKALRKNYENNNIRTPWNRKDNNVVKSSGSIYTTRNKA
jgi:cell division protein FtsB